MTARQQIPYNNTQETSIISDMGDGFVYEGVTYAEIQGFRPLLLDLRLPPAAGSGPTPLVVWIHGGAFWSGDRRYLPDTLPPGSVFDALVAAGIAVAAVDYRLSGEARFPAQLEDVLSAFAFLRRGCGRWGLDPERFGVWGESAGGTLAGLVALSSAAAVRAAAVWYPPTDLETLRPDGGDADSPEARLLGAPPARATGLARAASPVRQVGGPAAPFLIMHGTADDAVPVSQSEQLHARLLDAGTDSTLVRVEGAGHCFEGHTEIPYLIERTVAFFADHLLRP